jgi:adenosylcobyric acid synthase
MTETLLVAGTASHVGKSTVAAGLCRLLAERGVDVAPFKAQNMSNNARAVPCPTRDVAAGVTEVATWGEIGVSQYVQARAARVTATTDHNPVLLKPHDEGVSQVVVQGRPVTKSSAGSYYEKWWDLALEAAERSFDRLAREHDVIVAEGAGSVAEPNLRDRDLANRETARFADASVLLVADIERGGAFASIVGSMALAPDAIAERVCGVVLTKFRGDESLLEPAIEEIESRTGVPVLGVVPHADPGLPDEDSVSLPAAGERATLGADDGVSDEATVRIGVPRFPRISNATDLEPLAREPGVRVEYVPIEGDLDGIDSLVLPGTKNTVADLQAVRDGELGTAVRDFDGPIVGLCGGYQMLGERIRDADVESSEAEETVPGLGRLPVETTFNREKHVQAVTRELDGIGPLNGANGTVGGYEIHAGRTSRLDEVPAPVGPESAAAENALGTYLHDLFANDAARAAFIQATYRAADRERPSVDETHRMDPYESAAALLDEHVYLSGLPGYPDE